MKVKSLFEHFYTDDTTYDSYASKYQAKTILSQVLYLLAYLFPGMAAYILVNIKAVHDYCSDLMHLEGYNYQYTMFVLFTFLLHIGLPLLILRKYEKLDWREVGEFLSLNRFSLKEIIFTAPIAFAFSVVLSLPYMMYLYEPVQSLINAIPAFQIPKHSIFASYEAFYGAPLAIMILMLVGNFVGEEIYFRGYLMKKTAFLGRYN
jgi:hypothetical protein